MAEANKEVKPETPDLKRWQYAALAAEFSKEKPQYALMAMEGLYEQAGLKNDPIIGAAFNDAMAGIQRGTGISSRGMVEAIAIYSQKFNKDFHHSTLKGFLEHIEHEGYKLPEAVNKIIEGYTERNIGDILNAAKAKDAKEPDKAVAVAIEVLRNQLMEGQLLHKLVTRSTKNTLESLVQKEEN